MPGEIYNKIAAGYFASLRDEEGKILLEDLIEARWHYLQAVEWNQARKDIARVQEKLPREQFNAILKEFNLNPEDGQ